MTFTRFYRRLKELNRSIEAVKSSYNTYTQTIPQPPCSFCKYLWTYHDSYEGEYDAGCDKDRPEFENSLDVLEFTCPGFSPRPDWEAKMSQTRVDLYRQIAERQHHKVQSLEKELDKVRLEKAHLVDKRDNAILLYESIFGAD